MSNAAINRQTDPIPNFGGPVSAALESDLRTAVRRHGIVVWLDLDAHYSSLIDRLKAAREAGMLPYEVHALRGSHLELMLSLDGIAGGTEKARLVIHLPGLNEDTVKMTPIFEFYAAGVRYRRALDTVVTEAAAGRIRPEQIAAFRAQPGMTLASADAWLAALLNDTDGGIAPYLRSMKPTAVFDELLTGGFVASRIGQSEDENTIWERLASWTGVTAAWRGMTRTPQPRGEDVAFSVASWALCVEYLHDLKRRPLNTDLTAAVDLPRTVIDTCCEIAEHLRERHASFYQRTADETERLIAEEIKDYKAEDLGSIDTFRLAEDKVLTAALSALERSEWDLAATWSKQRMDAKTGKASFWLRDDPSRVSAWQLVGDAARLGQALARAGDQLGVGLGAGGSLEGALNAYAARGTAVDQAHRHLEQRRVTLLYPQIPEFEALRDRLDAMRRAWRIWADGWARDFNELCKAHGFLPTSSLQQRTLFDEVVRPLTQEAGSTAYFIVDAMRFEMGEELFRQLEGTPATTIHLKPRLAELPTVTEVGMNVLAPVTHNGRLSLVMSNDASRVQGFQAGQFRVADPETRKRAMHDRVGGTQCPCLTLEDVVTREGSSLKRTVAQTRLVVVHSTEIDNAGEQGVGPTVFDQVMQKLKAAWRLLRDAGVRRFVFTSDHGFLLLDDNARYVQSHGRRIDPKRRHVFSPLAADHPGEVRVALADLGYDGATGHVMFPDNTAVFDTGRRPTSFVHGGNSLQERVIPVLTVIHRAAAGGSTLQYGITAEARESVSGMHCLEAKIEMIAQRALDFGSPKDIELALRLPDDEGIQVELCQAGGKARIVGGIILAPVGEKFEIFFRLSGSSDNRVRVELYHPSAVADVMSYVPETLFAVVPNRSIPQVVPITDPRATFAWLEQVPESGARQVFQHLALHGTVTENEAVVMLGGPRGLRRFANHFEEFAKKVPFAVRIDVVGGIKRYVREGRE